MTHTDADHTDNLESAVLTTLSGVPLNTAAERASIPSPRLVEAVTAYRAAGREALAVRPSAPAWQQVEVQFSDYRSAERTVIDHLWPALHRGEEAGLLSSWWFVRKAPCWRIRAHTRPGSAAGLRTVISETLNEMHSRGLLAAWTETLYEPEAAAFGGAVGIQTAHRLFHGDSSAVLRYLAGTGPALGRRETSLLLLSTLLRGAGLEWTEQGDVWHRVGQYRPPGTDTRRQREEGTLWKVRRLMLVDAGPARTITAVGSPLDALSPWVLAFHEAGRALATAARTGMLERGLRAILAQHVLFHWNRIGLPAEAQGHLARAAGDVVLGTSCLR